MKRRGFVKFQLILLFVVVIGFVIKLTMGSSSEDGVVAFVNVDRNELYERHFRLDEPALMVVDAIGSFENSESLAVYGWIVVHPERNVVWQMDAAGSERGKLSRALVADTLDLDAGYYTAYFTTYGDPDIPKGEDGAWFEIFGGDARAWHADEDAWKFVMTEIIEGASPVAHRVKSDELPEKELARIGDDEFYNMRWGSNEYRFSVEQPTEILLQGIIDLPPDGSSNSEFYISSVSTGDQYWRLERTRTVPAGGALRNRAVRDTLTLEPGLYIAHFESHSGHYPDSWEANPPLDPDDWSLKILLPNGADIANIGLFDVWRLPKLADITRVGDDASISQSFVLNSDARVFAYGIGEIISGSAYDYGWIESDVSRDRVWDMSTISTQHAGGDGKNRVVESYLDLPAGSYTAHYESDGTHSYGSWNGTEPEYPARWGLTVILLDTTVTYRAGNVAGDETVAAPMVSSDYRDEILLVDMTGIGNNREEVRSLILEEDKYLHIIAVGEYIREWYDSGSIINTRTGESVWQMNYNNSRPAGGAEKNRMYDGVIRLPAGNYSVRFTTDGSHAYGSFEGNPPADPDSYGIRVWEARPVDG